MIRKLAAVLALELAALAPLTALASDKGSFGIRDENYRALIDRVISMPEDYELQERASRYGLNVLNVMWEDTGRDLGSSVGPNISDLSLQVRTKVRGGYTTQLLPVIRHPNFTDKTADVRADKLWVRVGNQNKGGELVAVPLTEVLANLKEYLSEPGSLLGRGDFSAKRDTHFLVSAQHVFVPLPKNGVAEFNPVLFNYQSSPGQPAVLTLLITREGMSATVIDNRNTEMSYESGGQQLYFNNAGQKTVFTAERKSAVKARIESGQATSADQGALEEGADMMMIVQVPLKYRAPRRGYGAFDDSGLGSGAMPMAEAPAKSSPGEGRRARSDVEEAVLGHGEDLGEFVEMNSLQLERDARFPVRVTVQFYKATSNGVVSDADLREVARTIGKVYSSGDYVGSLVVPESQQKRPTAWTEGQDHRLPKMHGFHFPRGWR
jgi:hypothetical protein